MVKRGLPPHSQPKIEHLNEEHLKYIIFNYITELNQLWCNKKNNHLKITEQQITKPFHIIKY